VILRAVAWPAVLGATATGATILTFCVAVPGDGPPLIYVRLALIALAGAAAFVLDEPAAAAVAAVPVSRRRRTALRLIAVALPFGVWVTGILGVAVGHAGTPVRGLIAEGAGVLAVAVAAAAALRAAGRDEPGELVASILGAVLLAVLLYDPPPHSVPLFPVQGGWPASTLLWAGLATVSGVVVVASSLELGGRLCNGPDGRRLRSGTKRTGVR
jgi:hypothetical protein